MRQAYIFHVIVPLRGVGCVWLTVMQNKNGGVIVPLRGVGCIAKERMIEIYATRVIVPLRGVGCIMEDLYPSPAMNKVIVPLRGVGCVVKLLLGLIIL